MPPGPSELASAADRARAAGDAAAARLRLEALRAVLAVWHDVEPRLDGLNPARARYLQNRQDEIRELLIHPDRWPVGGVVARLMDALSPLCGPAASERL